MEVFKKTSYKNLPQYPGVYLFLDKQGRVLYVGKAKSLKNRVSSYFLDKNLGPKTKLLVSKIEKIKIISVGSEVESLLLEASYIKKFTPFFNIKMTDGKSYPLIMITVKDKYPKILITRKINDPNSLYFGPYPNPTSLRLVLKTIRKIFPFQNVLNHPKKTCLYFHLGLCPCPVVFDSMKQRKIYKKNIKRIIKLLDGHPRTVLTQLIKDRSMFSKSEDFEEAQKIQDQINAINAIITPVYQPFEYDINPNLRSDLRTLELKELKDIFKNAGIQNSSLKRIECFDVSNISGQLATGSMVVFIDGEKEPTFYRRFKIDPKIVGPNDFAMIEEIIRRRVKYFDDWGMPNLIIVDGGKGQITSALKALREHKLKIPVIGLAKRDEIIITSKFKLIKLPKDSKALHLIMRIRDEAHRFAINYHRKLRSKMLKDNSLS